MKKRKPVIITDEKKEWAVENYLSKKMTAWELVAILYKGENLEHKDIRNRTKLIRNWADAYRNGKFGSGKSQIMSKETKQWAVDKFLSGKMTATEIAREIYVGVSDSKIRGRRTLIYAWAKKYKEFGSEWQNQIKNYHFTKGMSRFSLLREKWDDYLETNSSDELREWVSLKSTVIKKGYVTHIKKTFGSKYSLKFILDGLGVSKSTYYSKQTKLSENRGRKPLYGKNVEILILKIWKSSDKTYGKRRITSVLNNKHKINISVHSVGTRMRKLGIKSVIRNPKYPRERKDTTVNIKNEIQRQFIGEKPNHKWFTDVSYIFLRDGLFYLSIIIDGYDNSIVAYEFEDNQHTRVIMSNIKSAIRKAKDVSNLIIHSDHGSQYSSEEYLTYCKKKGITVSMSRVGDHLDNRPAEYFFSVIKQECVRFFREKGIYSYELAKKDIERFIKYYNTQRIQLCLNGMTPNEWRKAKYISSH